MNILHILSKSILSLCITATTCVSSLSAQDSIPSDFSYQINRVQKYISISPSKLDTAKTLSDLNHFYKVDWVKEYKSVNVTVITKGKKNTLNSTSDLLTINQKTAIKSADLGSEIKVQIRYLPDNNLSQNEISEMDFTFKIDPEVEATFIGGDTKLDQYINETAFQKITTKDVPQYQVAAIKFTIDEEGQVVDASIAQPSQNQAADQLLLTTICEMPQWQSAQYSDGTKTKQDFVFTVGDHYSCTMNILDIRSDTPASLQEYK